MNQNIQQAVKIVGQGAYQPNQVPLLEDQNRERRLSNSNRNMASGFKFDESSKDRNSEIRFFDESGGTINTSSDK